MKSSARIFLVSFLLLSFLSASIAYPISVNAQQKISENVIYKSARACIASLGTAAVMSLVARGMGKGISLLGDALKASSIPFLSALGGTTPQSVSDSKLQADSYLKMLKDYCLSPIVKSLAREMLARATSNILGWIERGAPNGTSLIVSNRSAFLSRLANIEINHYANEINSRNPYGQIVVRNIGNNYGFSFAMFDATLSDQLLNKIFGGTETFGWEAYVEAMRPQNNPIGLYLLTRETISDTIALTQGDAVTELDWSGGFQPKKECVAYDETSQVKGQTQKLWKDAEGNPIYLWVDRNNVWLSDQEMQPKPEGSTYGPYTNPKLAPNPNDWPGATFGYGRTTQNVPNQGIPGVDFPCNEWNVETPGTIVVDQLSNVLGSQIRQTELANDFDKDLSLIINALLDKFILSFVDSGFDSLQEKVYNPAAGPNFAPEYGTNRGSTASGVLNSDSTPLELTTIDAWISIQNKFIDAAEQTRLETKNKFKALQDLNMCYPIPRDNWYQEWTTRKLNIKSSPYVTADVKKIGALFGIGGTITSGISNQNILDQTLNRMFDDYLNGTSGLKKENLSGYNDPVKRAKIDKMSGLLLSYDELEETSLNADLDKEEARVTAQKNIDDLRLVKAYYEIGLDTEQLEKQLLVIGTGLYSEQDVAEEQFKASTIKSEAQLFTTVFSECKTLFNTEYQRTLRDHSKAPWAKLSRYNEYNPDELTLKLLLEPSPTNFELMMGIIKPQNSYEEGIATFGQRQ